MEELGKSWKIKFQELLKCGICLELYKEPKTLDCQHSFCKNCIYSAFPIDKSAFCCPTCRCPQSNLDSRNDIDSMICSLHLRQSLDLFLDFNSSNEELSTKKCDKGTIDEKEDFYVTKCTQNENSKDCYEKTIDPENTVLQSCFSHEEDDFKKNSDLSSDDEPNFHESFPYQKLKKTCKQKVISKITKLFFANNIENDFNELLSKRKDCLSRIEDPEMHKGNSDIKKKDSRDQSINAIAIEDSKYVSSTSILGGAISAIISQQTATKSKFNETPAHTTYTETKSVENNEENQGFMYGIKHRNRVGFLL